MSACTTCGGTGKVTCPTCHGQGFSVRVADDGQETRRLCGFCGGDRNIRCGACRGTGVASALHEPVPAASPRPAVAQPDRLAGRWNGQQGTWFEFVPDGRGYRATAGGPRGVSGQGTATLLGNKVGVDATDILCGHYSLELTLIGNHLEGIDRKAGFPIPVTFSRA